MRRRQSAGRFVVGKVRGKFVVLEILAYLPRDEVLQQLLYSSRKGREYVLANHKYIMNACKTLKKDKFLNFTNKIGCTKAFGVLQYHEKFCFHIKVASYHHFNVLMSLVPHKMIHSIEI